MRNCAAWGVDIAWSHDERLHEIGWDMLRLGEVIPRKLKLKDCIISGVVELTAAGRLEIRPARRHEDGVNKTSLI